MTAEPDAEPEEEPLVRVESDPEVLALARGAAQVDLAVARYRQPGREPAVFKAPL